MARWCSAALAVAGVSCAAAQSWDFEDAGFRGWSQTGKAFAGQPFCKRARDAEMPSTCFADARLGGTYWQDLEYPLGQHGNCVVTSLLKIPSAEPWSLTSPEFVVRAGERYLSFRVGGSNDPAHERVELQVRRDGQWVAVFTATGRGAEQLHQETFDMQDLVGATARVRIVDDSAAGHINVDYIQIGAAPPELRAPVWGYADYHTHPMTHLAFGSNEKRHIIWGNPGGRYSDYVMYGGTKKVSEDVPHCVHGHGGGYLAEGFVNNAQLFDDSIQNVLNAFLFPHRRSGGPEFADFPDHLMGAHEQMHITMIRRNYEGGLRLMVALVTDNWGASFLTGVAEKGQVALAAEKDSVVKQMSALRELVALNSSWMEIAQSAADARRIIGQDKLAIVPGVELDQLGSYDPDPEREVEFLWGLGVRAVTPIHAVDNHVGSPAILNGAYNWLNDFMANGAKQVRPGQLPPSRFFDIETDDCAGKGEPEGECVVHKLEPFPQLRLVIARPIFTFFQQAPGFVITKADAFDTKLGQKNAHGLKEKTGPAYIQALMKRGIIVDTAHMSDKSVKDTYGLLGEYPAVISHAHFRKEGLYDPETEITDYLASEYDISDSNLELVKRNGGVVGPFMHQARINPDSIDVHISHITDDCGNSSKGFAFAYHYGQQKVPGGIGMATDMTFIPVVSPRFGEHACEGFKTSRHGQQEKAMHPERYQPRAQKDPVAYWGIPLLKKSNQHDLLKPFRMDERVFDFNVDGLAHYGLVPDMLQDLKNVEMPKRDMQALFGSAEGYLRMWERVEAHKPR
jgi:microsomal dipeptidase-like Zn-dependent dipeptidase